LVRSGGLAHGLIQLKKTMLGYASMHQVSGGVSGKSCEYCEYLREARVKLSGMTRTNFPRAPDKSELDLPFLNCEGPSVHGRLIWLILIRRTLIAIPRYLESCQWNEPPNMCAERIATYSPTYSATDVRVKSR
jgi:hypothetical protein